MEYLIGIDLGTSGTKTVLFDRWGRSSPALRWSNPMYQERNGWPSRTPGLVARLLRDFAVRHPAGRVDPGTSRAWGFPARCTAW